MLSEKKKRNRPKFEHTVFLDRTHGKAMATLLRKVGIQVKSIHQVFPKKKHEITEDPIWIERCAKEGWIPVSGDKKLIKNVVNKNALVQHKIKLFLLSDTNSLPAEWASAVIMGQEKMANVIRKNPGPFYSMIQRISRGHVSHAKFLTEADKITGVATDASEVVASQASSTHAITI